MNKSFCRSGPCLCFDSCKKKWGKNGFTLIEVMVALIIFALLSVTLLVRIGDNLRAESYLKSKTIAALVAQNTLAELRLERDWEQVRSKTQTVPMADHAWSVSLEVKDTPNKNLRRVDIKVGPEEAGSSKDQSYFTLTSFIGRY